MSLNKRMPDQHSRSLFCLSFRYGDGLSYRTEAERKKGRRLLWVKKLASIEKSEGSSVPPSDAAEKKAPSGSKFEFWQVASEVLRRLIVCYEPLVSFFTCCFHAEKEQKKKHGAASVDSEPATPSARDSSIRKEDLEETMPTPAASSAAGDVQSESGSDTVMEENSGVRGAAQGKI